ncbi:MAG: hypothetical protein E7273_02265 [Pseudobutyrivibrio ruminis]|nr:hypothetical protein [Pseudobutyrivibrio ruminis]
MLNEEQNHVIVKTLRNKKLMLISGIMLAITLALGFATKTFSFSRLSDPIGNAYALSIYIGTAILLLAFIYHAAMYNSAKNDSLWDFIGAKDMDGNVDYKRLISENNIHIKTPVIQIILLIIVFLLNFIAINPAKLTAFAVDSHVNKLCSAAEADGYITTAYDYPSGTFGVIYCTRFAEDRDNIYKTSFSINLNGKNHIDSITYSYNYDNTLSEEDNFELADKQFEEFNYELVSFIDKGLLDVNPAKDYYQLAEEFKAQCLASLEEEYIYFSDPHYEDAYTVLYSRFNYKNDEEPSVSISIMFD